MIAARLVTRREARCTRPATDFSALCGITQDALRGTGGRADELC